MRSRRRHHAERIKARMKKYYPSMSEKDIGRLASTHGSDCSCWMCGNPRRYMKGIDKLTIQERKNENT